MAAHGRFRPVATYDPPARLYGRMPRAARKDSRHPVPGRAAATQPMKYHNRIKPPVRLNRGETHGGRGRPRSSRKGTRGKACVGAPVVVVVRHPPHQKHESARTRALRGPGCDCNVGSVPRPPPKQAGEAYHLPRLSLSPHCLRFYVSQGYTVGARQLRRVAIRCPDPPAVVDDTWISEVNAVLAAAWRGEQA